MYILLWRKEITLLSPMHKLRRKKSSHENENSRRYFPCPWNSGNSWSNWAALPFFWLRMGWFETRSQIRGSGMRRISSTCLRTKYHDAGGEDLTARLLIAKLNRSNFSSD